MLPTIQTKKFGVGLFISATLLAGGFAALAQPKRQSQPKQQPQEEENSRRFWPPEFRPAAPTGAKPRQGTYKPANISRPPSTITKPDTESTGLGVTLWLLRSPSEIKQAAQPSESRSNQPKKSAQENKDEIARVLVKKKIGNSERTEEMVPERIEANTPLKVGQLLRLSVEVPQDGYLYVIDREKYTDKTVGDPILIFPSNPRSAEHLVKAGRIIELPDSKDYVFEVKLMSDLENKTLAGEVLSFLVSPRPLENIPEPGADGLIRLPAALVTEWENKWGQNNVLSKAELDTGRGRARTRSEQNALTGNSKELNQADPLPQTVFTIAVKRGSPYLVQMPLTIGK
ncbi:MAG: DUF4384 domain-containing protein [Acidobacteria bacterium]|nr:DUF4384 domain-containing protein [Acidobacteriota bacterium]MBI3425335.1 DUF4384 domain-containing protein [Acidobacteriota bacterium]